MLLARSQVNGEEVILVHSLLGGEQRVFDLGKNQELDWYRWAGNNRILLSIGQSVPWYDDEARSTRLVVYEIAAKKFTTLGPKRAGLEGDDLLFTDPSGEWILLAVQKTVYDYPSVFRVKLADNSMEEVVKQRTDVWEWYADHDGVVRAGIGSNGESWSMVYRKGPEEKFRKLGKARYDDEEASLNLLRFSRDSDEGYVLRNQETGRYALYHYNFATKQVIEKIIESPTNDITDFDTDVTGSKLRAVWYTDERDRVVWFDPILKQVQQDIESVSKGREVWIVSRTPDNTSFLVWLGGSHDPGTYYYYRPSTGRMQFVAHVNSALKAADLAPAKYIRYKARDGLEIPAYLTLPKGREAKNLPLVIVPHGGPYGVRDRPDYDAEIQFLANRGYAVLQPNYRGSDGYGKAFYEKGEGQWGRQMQDDLDDGMDSLVKDGIVDAKRVCLVGASYGGYAAIWGVTRNPERYRCAASFAGVMDLKSQLKYQVDYLISRKYRKDWRKTVLGDQKFDSSLVSPLANVDRLTRPVLLAHGDIDKRVPYKQSSTYASVLAKAGKPHVFHTYKNEGHGFSKPENQKDWLDRLDAFLRTHNPPD